MNTTDRAVERLLRENRELRRKLRAADILAGAARGVVDGIWAPIRWQHRGVTDLEAALTEWEAQ